MSLVGDIVVERIGPTNGDGTIVVFTLHKENLHIQPGADWTPAPNVGLEYGNIANFSVTADDITVFAFGPITFLTYDGFVISFAYEETEEPLDKFKVGEDSLWIKVGNERAPLLQLDTAGAWTIYDRGNQSPRILITPNDYNNDTVLEIAYQNNSRGYLLIHSEFAGTGGAAVNWMHDAAPGVLVLEGIGGTRIFLWHREVGGAFALFADIADPGRSDASPTAVQLASW